MNTMSKIGRPTELTDEVIRKIEEVAALDGTVEEMAFFANVHRATIYRWLKEDKDFSDRIKDLRQRPFLKARQTIVKALDDPNHAFKYMERKKKKEFGANMDVTSNGAGLPTPIIKLSTDENEGTDKKIQ